MGKGSFLKGIISNPADCFLFPHQIGDANSAAIPTFIQTQRVHLCLTLDPSIISTSAETHTRSVDKNLQRKSETKLPRLPPSFDAKD